MKYCNKCGNEMVDDAVVCPRCGCMVVEPAATQLNDKVNVGLCVLSALIPLFGIIYWPVKHKESPKKAQACGITALIAWGIYFLMLI